MWIVMKAFSWGSLTVEGLPLRGQCSAAADLGDRFIPVFDSYEKAKEFADKEGVDLIQVQEVLKCEDGKSSGCGQNSSA